MRGWLVTSAFVRDDEYEDLLQRFEDAAARAGVSLERRTNVELAPSLGTDGALPDAPDFALFWCKDIQVARHLEAHGVRLFNRAEAIELSDDKAATVSALLGTGVRQPRTVPVPRSDAHTAWGPTGFAEATAATLGLPVVVKEVRGSFGQEVHLARTVAELTKLLDELSGHACICQEFIASSEGRDVRVQVVGDRAVGAILRFSQTGDFRANINSGASYRGYEATPEQEAVAVAATQGLGLDFAGVDLLFGADGRPVLCEVNSNAHSIPEMLEECGVNVADEIMRHIVATVRRRRSCSPSNQGATKGACA